MNKWNQSKYPDANPHPLGHLIFYKDVKIMKQKKESISSTNGARITGCQLVEKCKLILVYHPAEISRPSQLRPQHKSRYTEPDKRGTTKQSQMH